MSAHRTRVERMCLTCGKTFMAKPNVIGKGGGKFCSISCGVHARAVPLETRFRQHCGPVTKSGCVLWTGSLSVHGKYGLLGGTRRSACLKAHRVAWELANGAIPDGMYVCHSCDQPACVAINHLFLGTQADNMADMVSKGRQSKGESIVHAKLTAETVLLIRSRYRTGQATLRQMAAEFNLRADYLSKLVSGKYWKHLPLQ